MMNDERNEHDDDDDMGVWYNVVLCGAGHCCPVAVPLRLAVLV